MRRSFTRTIVFLFALAILWATYDNVLRANDDVQAMADRAASMVKPPAEKHGMTKMDRTPLKESFEFTWPSGGGGGRMRTSLLGGRRSGPARSFPERFGESAPRVELFARRRVQPPMPYRDEDEVLRERYRTLEGELSHMKESREVLAGLDAKEAKLREEMATLTRSIARSRRRTAPGERGPLLSNLSVATPCPARWEDMVGDERTRFCSGCRKDVHNISALDAAAAETLLREKSGGLVRAVLPARRRHGDDAGLLRRRGAARTTGSSRVIAAGAFGLTATGVRRAGDVHAAGDDGSDGGSAADRDYRGGDAADGCAGADAGARHQPRSAAGDSERPGAATDAHARPGVARRARAAQAPPADRCRHPGEFRSGAVSGRSV